MMNNPTMNCDDIAKLDYNQTISLIKSICNSGQLSIQNPLTKQNTQCVASAQRGISNLLKFCDHNGANVWYLVQISSFIDAWVCGESFFCYENSPTVKGTTKKLPNWISSGVIQFEESSDPSRPITGMLISGNRPYHFLHDRYLYAAELSLIHELHSFCYRNRKCFVSALPTPSGFKTIQSRPPKGCFIASCIRKDQFNLDSLNKTAEHLRREYAPTTTHRFDGLTVWLGITSQTNRRMWIEQIEGYSEYVRYLASATNGRLRILIDGWTSYAENMPSDEDTDSDQRLANQLATRLSNLSDVVVESIVGQNYANKIAYALASDLAITNDCSGSLITHTIGRRPSIMHGNAVIRSTPPGISYSSARFVDSEHIKIIPGPKPSNTDYSMEWAALIPDTLALLEKHLNQNKI